MIRKWYQVTCDYCSGNIKDYNGNVSIRALTELLKKDGAIVRYKVGYRAPFVFCDEECHKKWENNH